MVRSVASSSSGEVGPAYTSEDSDSSEGSGQERAAEARAERFRGHRRDWFRRHSMELLCELALERQLREGDSADRRLAARVATFRRRCRGRTAEDIVEFTLPQLAQPSASALCQDAAAILQLLDTPVPPNDEHWILSDQVGRTEDPQRHRVEQRMQLLLRPTLDQYLHGTSAQAFLDRLVADANGFLYRDFMLLMWPLLSQEDRFLFQQWYQGRTADHYPAAARPEQPERARGSSDPPPGDL